MNKASKIERKGGRRGENRGGKRRGNSREHPKESRKSRRRDRGRKSRERKETCERKKGRANARGKEGFCYMGWRGKVPCWVWRLEMDSFGQIGVGYDSMN